MEALSEARARDHRLDRDAQPRDTRDVPGGRLERHEDQHAPRGVATHVGVKAAQYAVVAERHLQDGKVRRSGHVAGPRIEEDGEEPHRPHPDSPAARSRARTGPARRTR